MLNKRSKPFESRKLNCYLLLEEHSVDGLTAGQDHHGKSDGHRHHEAHADHLRYQVGREVHQHVACDFLCETDVAEEAHLVRRRGVWGGGVYTRLRGQDEMR